MYNLLNTIWEENTIPKTEQKGLLVKLPEKVKTPLHVNFTVFKKAFDSIHRDPHCGKLRDPTEC